MLIGLFEQLHIISYSPCFNAIFTIFSFSPPSFLSSSPFLFSSISLYHLHWHLSLAHPTPLPCLNYSSSFSPSLPPTAILSPHSSFLISPILCIYFFFLLLPISYLLFFLLLYFSTFQSKSLSPPLLSLHLYFPRVTHMVFKWNGAH